MHLLLSKASKLGILLLYIENLKTQAPSAAVFVPKLVGDIKTMRLTKSYLPSIGMGKQ